MIIPNLGVLEIPIAVKGQDAYIPVKNLFDFLKIKNETTNSGIQGFIIHPDSTYQINPIENIISYKGDDFELKDSDYIQSPTTFYLKSDLFGKIFGLNTNFSFRSLSVSLETKKELPVIKEMRLRKMRENLNQVKGIITPDTSIARNYPFFNAGSLDWEIITTQSSAIEYDNRLTLTR